MNTQRLIRLLLILQLAFICSGISAHENLPASLILQEHVQEKGVHVFDVRWRIPQTQGRTLAIDPVFPSDCAAQSPVTELTAPGARLHQWQIRCNQGLRSGASIAFAGLSLAMVDVVVRVQYRDGSSESHIARIREPNVKMGQTPTPTFEQAVSSYFGLGVEHILTGVDHLLFVLCLLMLTPNLLSLFKTITAFTLAHSITLALSALQVVQVPQPPVEAAIALSILFLARERAFKYKHQRSDHSHSSGTSLTLQRPWIVAFIFGLLHGFGFAGALAEIGLPQGDIPTALLLFNLGVEAGQLAFVTCVVGVLWLLRRWQQLWPPWVVPLPVYAVGAVSGFWWLQRMVPVLGLRGF